MAERDYAILYVASSAHSGSTLLDLLIASHAEAVGLGEVKVLSQHPRHRSRRERLAVLPCACGATPVARCPFWQAVDRELRASSGPTLATLDLESEEPGTFRRHNRAFFDAVHRVSGSRLIVDSSKSTRRLEALDAAGVFDVRCIHLVRSPHGVVYSQVRRGRPWLPAARNWIRAEMRMRRATAGRDVLKLRYEDVARQPARTLPGVMAWLGLTFEPRQLDWADHTHHHVAGNPMRRASSSEIRVDDAWRRELGALRKAGVAWVTLPARLPGTRLYDLSSGLWRLESPIRLRRRSGAR